MTGRLILAIIGTILEEAAIVIIVLWGLPEIGIHIPLPGLIALMLGWATYAVVTHRMGTRALKKKPVMALPDMVGSEGVVVSPLEPDGLVRIRGELWAAKSESGEIEPGVEVTVVGQNSLKLEVRETPFAHGSEITE